MVIHLWGNRPSPQSLVQRSREQEPVPRLIKSGLLTLDCETTWGQLRGKNYSESSNCNESNLLYYPFYVHFESITQVIFLVTVKVACIKPLTLCLNHYLNCPISLRVFHALHYRWVYWFTCKLLYVLYVQNMYFLYYILHKVVTQI